MKNIHLETQGVKGGDAKTQKVGYVVVGLRNESDLIVVDDFIGMGISYKQREQQRIDIIENGNILFSGSKYELFEKLKTLKDDNQN